MRPGEQQRGVFVGAPIQQLARRSVVARAHRHLVQRVEFSWVWEPANRGPPPHGAILAIGPRRLDLRLGLGDEVRRPEPGDDAVAERAPLLYLRRREHVALGSRADVLRLHPLRRPVAVVVAVGSRRHGRGTRAGGSTPRWVLRRRLAGLALGGRLLPTRGSAQNLHAPRASAKEVRNAPLAAVAAPA